MIEFVLEGRDRAGCASLVESLREQLGGRIVEPGFGAVEAGLDAEERWWSTGWLLSLERPSALVSIIVPSVARRTDDGIELVLRGPARLRAANLNLDEDWVVFSTVLASGPLPSGVEGARSESLHRAVPRRRWGFHDKAPIPADLFVTAGVDPNLDFWWPMLHLSPPVLDAIGTPAEAGLETAETMDLRHVDDHHGLVVLRNRTWPDEDDDIVRAWRDYLAPAIGLTDQLRSYVTPMTEAVEMHPAALDLFAHARGLGAVPGPDGIGPGRFREDFIHPSLPELTEPGPDMPQEVLRRAQSIATAPPLEWPVSATIDPSGGAWPGLRLPAGVLTVLSSPELVDRAVDSTLEDLNGLAIGTTARQRTPVPVLAGPDPEPAPKATRLRRDAVEREADRALLAPEWAFPMLRWIRPLEAGREPAVLVLWLDATRSIGPVHVEALPASPRTRKRRLAQLSEFFTAATETLAAQGLELGPTPDPADWANSSAADFDIAQWLRLDPPPSGPVDFDELAEEYWRHKLRLANDDTVDHSSKAAMDRRMRASQLRRSVLAQRASS